MSKSFLVTVAITHYFETIVQAPDAKNIENFRHPDFGSLIEGDGLEKLVHPEWHHSPQKREVALVEIIEGI